MGMSPNRARKSLNYCKEAFCCLAASGVDNDTSQPDHDYAMGHPRM